MQSLVIRLGLAGLTASAMIALIPAGGAAAAEPLPAGTYEVVVPDGAISFEVFYDGAVRVLSSPDGIEVTFRFDDDVKVLDEFSVTSPGGAFEVDIDVDEAGGGYAYDVDAVEPQETVTADESAVDSSESESVDEADGPEVTDDERGRPSDLPAPPACEISQGRAPEKNPNCPDTDTTGTATTDADADTDPGDEDTTSAPGQSASRGEGSGRGSDVSPGRGRR